MIHDLHSDTCDEVSFTWLSHAGLARAAALFNFATVFLSAVTSAMNIQSFREQDWFANFVTVTSRSSPRSQTHSYIELVTGKSTFEFISYSGFARNISPATEMRRGLTRDGWMKTWITSVNTVEMRFFLRSVVGPADRSGATVADVARETGWHLIGSPFRPPSCQLAARSRSGKRERIKRD